MKRPEIKNFHGKFSPWMNLRLLTILLTLTELSTCTLPYIEELQPFEELRLSTDNLVHICQFLDLQTIMSLRCTCRALYESSMLENYSKLFHCCLDEDMLLLREDYRGRKFVCHTDREADQETILNFLQQTTKYDILVDSAEKVPLIMVRNLKSLLKLQAYSELLWERYGLENRIHLQLNHFEEEFLLENGEMFSVIFGNLSNLDICDLSESEFAHFTNAFPFADSNAASISISSNIPRGDTLSDWKSIYNSLKLKFFYKTLFEMFKILVICAAVLVPVGYINWFTLPALGPIWALPQSYIILVDAFKAIDLYVKDFVVFCFVYIVLVLISLLKDEIMDCCKF